MELWLNAERVQWGMGGGEVLKKSELRTERREPNYSVVDGLLIEIYGYQSVWKETGIIRYHSQHSFMGERPWLDLYYWQL